MTKNKYHFEDKHIVLDTLPKKFKKITATRFAAVMGLNHWTTPFQIWCALTRTWEQPYEDTIYTIAGKIIEPKIREDYLRDKLFWDVDNPDAVIGDGTPGSAFRQTYGDFFPHVEILGGMWDGLGHDDETGEDYILEIKTTKRAEDWLEGVPEYYKLQAALYTYLSGLDKFYVTGTFLEASDYEHPEYFIANTQNTKVFEFSLAEEYPNFKKDYVEPVLDFWKKYVETGISPDFDEKKDAEPLRALKTIDISESDTDYKSLTTEFDDVQFKLDQEMNKLQPLIDRQKELKNKIKNLTISNFKDDDKYAELKTPHYVLTLTKAVRSSVDSKKLKSDGLYEKYSKETETFTLKQKVRKD